MEIPENWTFKSEEITKNFDAHVNEQLPWYEFASFSIAHLVACFLRSGGTVYDIGSSTGNIIKRIEDTVRERRGNIISIDESIFMINSQVGDSKKICSPAESFLYEDHCVSILFLSLSFVNVNKRKSLLLSLIGNLEDGGAIILVDKVSFPSNYGYLETCLKRMTVLFKQKNKIPNDEIIKKELSINGISRPVDFYLLSELGFKIFFKVGEFEGYIYEK